MVLHSPFISMIAFSGHVLRFFDFAGLLPYPIYTYTSISVTFGFLIYSIFLSCSAVLIFIECVLSL
ncbi:hypothetical protein ACJIZ3_009022 [Penstemon smallii]|uniref:Uncharacterized protein n=1 Tax=Penstemon smallii TaxID=265156 RepID=A0ABD3TCF5_9LAMI